MGGVLALVEGTAIFAAASAAALVERWLRPGDWTDLARALGEGAVLACCALAAGYYADLYDFRGVRTFGRFASRFVRWFMVASLLLVGLSLLRATPPASMVGSAVLAAALLLVVRAVFYGVVLRLRPFVERVLILGSGPLARMLVEEIGRQPHHGYVIDGIVDGARTPGSRLAGCPVVGHLEDLARILQEIRPDRIVVALAERRRGLPSEQLLGARVKGVIVEEGAELYERLTGKIAIEALTPSSVIFCQGFRKSRVALAVGRAMSLLIAVVGLVTLAPLLGLIALLIKLDSSGPVLFLHERMGMNGKRFNLIKFRTMHPADHRPSEWARDNDDRITRVGKWLRKFWLDELPQFVNVLRGDMNLVGPRPHPVTNVGLFTLVLRNAPECGTEIPYYSLRSIVRPGISGWAQVRYRYANDLEEEIEKMRYDLYYVKHMSLRLDLRILFDTVKIVLRGRDTEAPIPERVRAWEVSGDTRTLRTNVEHPITHR